MLQSSGNSNRKEVKFYNYRLSTDLSDIAIDTETSRPKVVDCLNPHSFVTALSDDDYRKALETCDYLVPDGEGICMAMKWVKGVKIHKIAGDDIHNHLLKKLNDINGKAFYFGSSEKVLRLIADRIHREYPAITVETLSPSYCEELSEEESQDAVKKIDSFNPDVLFVSMTAPKQEKWIACNIDHIKTPKLIAAIGGVFDFFAGTHKRAPEWAVRMKMEWLVRLLKEPRRMWKRNFVSTPKFMLYVFCHRKEI